MPVKTYCEARKLKLTGLNPRTARLLVRAPSRMNQQTDLDDQAADNLIGDCPGAEPQL